MDPKEWFTTPLNAHQMETVYQTKGIRGFKVQRGRITGSRFIGPHGWKILKIPDLIMVYLPFSEVLETSTPLILYTQTHGFSRGKLDLPCARGRQGLHMPGNSWFSKRPDTLVKYLIIRNRHLKLDHLSWVVGDGS